MEIKMEQYNNNEWYTGVSTTLHESTGMQRKHNVLDLDVEAEVYDIPYAEMGGPKFFVEIGSCDFNTLNGLALKGWGGIIVEPVQKYFDKLEKHPGVQYINSAIDVNSSFRDMYLYNEDLCQRDRDFSVMSSFKEYVIEANRGLVESVRVSTISYPELIFMHDVKRIDFLKIDTEGHDWVILQMVIYEGPLRPKLIKAETKHLGQNKSAAVALLEERDYLVYQEQDDLYAIDLRK
jgi:hypothetical protein